MAIITARAIEAAKPKDKEYKLTADKGLYLCVYPTGIKRWLVRFVINGKQIQTTLPQSYGFNEGCLSLAQARAENERIQNLAKIGVDFRDLAKENQEKEKQAQKIKAIEDKTFSDLFETWLADGVSRQDNNAELKRMFNKDVLPFLAKKRVSDITETDIRFILKKIMKDRGTNRIAVRIHKDIIQLFKWAEERQPWRKLLIEGNPAKVIDIRSIISPEYEDIYGISDRLLSDEEILELYNIYLKTTKDYDNATADDKKQLPKPLPEYSQIATWLCLSTLCRIGELLMAEWKHVNFTTNEWFIPKENVKTTRGKKQDLIVFLSPFAAEQLKKLYNLTGTSKWLFPNDKKTSYLYIKTITRQINDRQVMFKNRQEDAKSKRNCNNSLVLAKGENGDWTPHDLRRTGATLMQKLKVDPMIIDRCQNHITHASKVRRHYQLYDYADEKKEAWFKLGEYLDKNVLKMIM